MYHDNNHYSLRNPGSPKNMSCIAWVYLEEIEAGRDVCQTDLRPFTKQSQTLSRIVQPHRTWTSVTSSVYHQRYPTITSVIGVKVKKEREREKKRPNPPRWLAGSFKSLSESLSDPSLEGGLSGLAGAVSNTEVATPIRVVKGY